MRCDAAARPGQHGPAEVVHEIFAEQETAWHAQQSTEETHHGAFAEHPAEQADRFGADRADGPHHRSPVFDGQQDGVHGDEDADDDACQRGEVETLCAVGEYGRQVRPGRACRCDAGYDAIGVGRDVSAVPRKDERGGDVTGGREHAGGDVRRRRQQHVAVVDPLDAVELGERPTQVRRTRWQAGDPQFVAELYAMSLGDGRGHLEWHAGTVCGLDVAGAPFAVERADQ